MYQFCQETMTKSKLIFVVIDQEGGMSTTVGLKNSSALYRKGISNTEDLKNKVIKHLEFQGFLFKNNEFILDNLEDNKRIVHATSRAERIVKSLSFIESRRKLVEDYLLDSKDINPLKIRPRIIEVKPNTIYADIFRWWNLVWWSLPFEKSYGRQMRFIVWDDYHDAPIGLIGLQSPILSWGVRDNHLGISAKDRDFWVNQSMSAQRIGALPPYNNFLGGKLIASLMTTEKIVETFRKKYNKHKTLLLNREIPANLLFITTTGAFGKSSIYNRLKHKDERVCKFIGYSRGSGSFHIPNTLYESLVDYLQSEGKTMGRSYGNGPSAKMKIISKSMSLLGFKNGANHGIKRGVYLFELVTNLHDVIQNGAKPKWVSNRTEVTVSEFWKERWLSKRVNDSFPNERLFFSRNEYLQELNEDLLNCNQIISKLNSI